MTVALIGRPNVGKSTLFNRLIEKRSALETATPGTTRDQNRDFLNWSGTEIEIIDTPGLHKVSRERAGEEDKLLEEAIQIQAKRASEKADIILYILDFGVGPTAEDREFIKKLRREKNNSIILVINKVDSARNRNEALLYANLGLRDPIPVSALNGMGTGDLLDAIVARGAHIPKKNKTERKNNPVITLALVGKPNVGKSSLFNAILQEERVVVSPVPHTTRDPNVTEIEYNGYYFHLVDTAGLAKKARVYDHGEIEIFSVKKTLETIKKADIGILMINANENASLQDKKIRALLEENRCGIIILANKWDMVSLKNTASLGLTRKKLYDDFKSINWAPIIFSSVANHRRGQVFGIEDRFVAPGAKSRAPENPIYALLDVVISVFKNRHTTVSDEELKKWLMRVVARKAPPRAPGFPYPKISRVTQVGVNPPRFSIRIPKGARLADHYFGYLTNQLRESFQLWGTVVSVGVE